MSLKIIFFKCVLVAKISHVINFFDLQDCQIKTGFHVDQNTSTFSFIMQFTAKH